jgi:4a-hydroxytetrahydrobiopterin dehydratase
MDSATQTLNDSQIRDVLRDLPEWALEDGKLVRYWTFPGFVQAMEFVDGVAQIAEREGHHPDIDIRYNRVKLALISHDAGGITQRDAQMAHRLSQAVSGP